ncbi:MAG: DUF485 domain-containing protein [Gammaproteobacteria bacterium]|nr:MAG: DUF485 domain-containing protein [Gammaproteobacteria bacterium]
MSKLITEQCLEHPKFQQLVSSRGRMNLIFSLIIIIGYGIFVLGMAYAPELMSQPISPTGSITYGIAMGLFMIVTGVVSSGIYIRWANQKCDPLKQELLNELDYE